MKVLPTPSRRLLIGARQPVSPPESEATGAASGWRAARPLDGADTLLWPALLSDEAYWRGKPRVAAIPEADSRGGLPESLDSSALRSWAEQATGPPHPAAWGWSAVIDRSLVLTADFERRRCDGGSLDVALTAALLSQHAQFLAQPPPRSDAIRAAAALASVALTLPELHGSARWLRRALSRLTRFAGQATPSGLVPGGGLATTVANVRALSAAVAMLSANGMAVPPHVADVAARGQETLRRLIRSDGSVALVRAAMSPTPERAELFDVDAGVVVLRGLGDRHVTMAAAAQGVGLSVYGAGREWLMDVGVTARDARAGDRGRIIRATRTAPEGLAAFLYRLAGAEVCRTVRLRPSGVLLVTDVVRATSARPQLLTQRFRPGNGIDVTWTEEGCRLSDGSRAALVTFSAGRVHQAGDHIAVDSGRPRTRWTATMKVTPA